jgi:hypothetical protein
VIKRLQSRLDWLPAGIVYVVAAILGLGVSSGRLSTGIWLMLAVLVAALLAVRAWLGATGSRTAYVVRVVGLIAVAAEALATVWWIRGAQHPDSIDRVVLVVWTIMLVIHLLAVTRLTAARLRLAPAVLGAGAVFGLVTFAVWALLCLMAPGVPTSNVPAVLALALAALAAIQWTRRDTGSARLAAIAGLSAAVAVAFLSAVFIDAVLPHLGRWVTNSAPPYQAGGPLAPYRLVDAVGLLLLGTLIAVALLVTLLPAVPGKEPEPVETATAAPARR